MSLYYIVIAGFLGVATGILVVGGLFKLRLTNIERRFSCRIKQLESEMAVLNSSAVGLGKKVLRLESRLARVGEIQDEMKSKDGDIAFLQAQKLIEQGVDNLTVANNCGLSDSEINLMRLLHNEQARPAQSAALL